jgi:hypothetical protein
MSEFVLLYRLPRDHRQAVEVGARAAMPQGHGTESH